MTFAYHRLARSAPNYRWWKALVTGAIALAFYVVLSLVLTVVFVVIAALDPDGFGVHFDNLVNGGVIDNSVPLILVFSLGSVALMLPAIILARLIMGPRPLGLISSVEGRLRWRWMLRLVVPALIAFGASFVLYLLVLPPLFGEPILPPVIGPTTWVMLGLVLLLVPLQATAEEYVFRGYLMQTLGGWLKHPAWAILIPVPLFMAGHIYDIWGLLDVGVFALFAGWITWRTGGLEAAIVAHVINNAAIFSVGAFGLVDVNASEGSPLGVLVTALTLGFYSWFVLRMSAKHGIYRVREAAPAVVPAVAFAEAPLVETQPQTPDEIVDNHS